MSYYEQLLKQKGLTLSEEARINRDKLRRPKAPPRPLKALANQQRHVAKVHKQADKQELAG